MLPKNKSSKVPEKNKLELLAVEKLIGSTDEEILDMSISQILEIYKDNLLNPNSEAFAKLKQIDPIIEVLSSIYIIDNSKPNIQSKSVPVSNNLQFDMEMTIGRKKKKGFEEFLEKNSSIN